MRHDQCTAHCLRHFVVFKVSKAFPLLSRDSPVSPSLSPSLPLGLRRSRARARVYRLVSASVPNRPPFAPRDTRRRESRRRSASLPPLLRERLLNFADAARPDAVRKGFPDSSTMCAAAFKRWQRVSRQRNRNGEKRAEEREREGETGDRRGDREGVRGETGIADLSRLVATRSNSEKAKEVLYRHRPSFRSRSIRPSKSNAHAPSIVVRLPIKSIVFSGNLFDGTKVRLSIVQFLSRESLRLRRFFKAIARRRDNLDSRAGHGTGKGWTRGGGEISRAFFIEFATSPRRDRSNALSNRNRERFAVGS